MLHIFSSSPSRLIGPIRIVPQTLSCPFLSCIFLLWPTKISCRQEFSAPTLLCIHSPTFWAKQWAVSLLHKDSLRLTWRHRVKAMKVNVRADGTEGIAKGKGNGGEDTLPVPLGLLRTGENRPSLWSPGELHFDAGMGLSEFFLSKG